MIFYEHPKTAGCWVIGERLKIYVKVKPNAWQRFNHWISFGWKWEDK